MHRLHKVRVQVSRWFPKNLIRLTALLLLFALLQVRGLVLQTGWDTLIPFLLFMKVARGGDFLGRRKIKAVGEQYRWDFGGQPFGNGDVRPLEGGPYQKPNPGC